MSFIKIAKPRPHVTQITLNRPERMNAMAFDVVQPLIEELREITYDSDTRVVILTGVEKGFCSGADLENPGWLDRFDGHTLPGIARRSMDVMNDVVRTIRAMNQPVIGAINGAAIGGGFCVAMATDIRIASEGAYFRPAGINNGLTSAELGLSYLLPRAIGSSRSFEIMLSGRDVGAEEAERIGMVSRTVPHEQLLDECYKLAEQIASYSQNGVEMSKQMLWSGLEASSMENQMTREGNAQLYVRLLTKNFEEAIKARKEGRKPEFKD